MNGQQGEDTAPGGLRARFPFLSGALLERLAVCALLLMAFVPRVRDLGRGFDRGFEGYQGAFFAIAAVNYERLGVATSGGYPVLNIDLPERSEELFVYANHSPLVPLLGWSSLKLLGPQNWANVANTQRAEVEAPLRLPFLILHMLGLLALWYVARVAFGTQVALLSLALVASLPVSALYGVLVNYENPALPFLLFAVASYGHFVRNGKPRALISMGLGFFAACAFTFAPVFFLPFLVLRSLWKRRTREALAVAGLGSVACLLPLLLHGWWARRSLAALGASPMSIWDRAQELLGPLIDGSIPVATWSGLQLQHMASSQGTVLIALAIAGALVCLVRALSPRKNLSLCRFEWPLHTRGDVDLALPLLAGGLAYMFAFYRHTAEEQWSFQLFLVPGVVLCAARALHGISLPLQRLRGGIAPLVLVAGSVMLMGLARFEVWRRAERAPGSHEDPALVRGPAAPLPHTVGTQLADLLPAGSVGFHPSRLGLTPASAWYSWRSLFPIEGPADPSAELVAQRLGLRKAPQFFVLPVLPPAGAEQEIEALRRVLGPATRSNSNWQAWPFAEARAKFE